MNEPLTQSTSQNLAQLSGKVSELIALCDRLKLENESLREQHGTLTEERAALLEQNELARTRVEAMINRLKAME